MHADYFKVVEVLVRMDTTTTVPVESVGLLLVM